MGGKSLLFQTALLGTRHYDQYGGVLSGMERVIAAHTGINANEALTETVVEGASDAIKYRPQPTWESVV